MHWATRSLLRSIAVGKKGPFVDAAQIVLGQLRALPEWEEGLAPLDPADLDELLAFLDIDPAILPKGIDALAEDDRMAAVMVLGDMASERFVPVIAAAISGRWGAGAMRSALKRFRAFADRKSIRDALVTLRASPLSAEALPYLDFAERDLPAEIVDDTRKPARSAAPAKADDVGTPWWKFW